MSAYLDHAASTPMFPEAFEAMRPFLVDRHENPSSPHTGGRAARRAVDDARDALAELVGCQPGELVLTSGGTEADNLAISGPTLQRTGIVVSAVEHHAVLEPAARRGALLAPVDAIGRVDLGHLADLLNDEVGLVSVMAVNNELGVLEPLDEVVNLVRERAPEALLHCDAVQAVPWCEVAAMTATFDLVTLSAHKFGGPKGIGGLVVRPRARPLLQAQQVGGAQEFELRGGTENVAGIVGAGAAARRWGAERQAIGRRVGELRDRLEDGLAPLGGVANVPRDARVVSFAPLHFAGTSTEELLFALDQVGVAASAGAACASGALEPSHVLAAIGKRAEEIDGSLRLSLGWSTTTEEIDDACAGFAAVLPALVSETGSS